MDDGHVTLTSTRRFLALAICYLVMMLEGYEISSIGIAAPAVVREMHLAPAEMGFIFSASMLGMLLGAFTLGRFADRIGRKPVLAVSVLIIALFTFTTIYAESFSSFMLTRFLVGIGLGGTMPNLIAVSAEVTPLRQRTSIVAFMFSGLSIGGILCALVAQVPAVMANWRLLFELGGVLPLAIAPLVWWGLPETHGAAAEPQRRASSTVQILFADGKATATVLLWIMAAMTLVVFYLMLNWLPTIAIAKGLGPAAAPLVILVFNVGNLFGAMIVGFCVDKVGFRWTMLAVYLCLIVAVLFLASTNDRQMVILLCAAAGLFINAAQAAIYGVVPHYYPADGRATGAGSVVAAARLGSILGPLYAGLLLGAGYKIDQVLQFSTPVLAIAALATLVLTVIGTHAVLRPQSQS